MNDVMTPAGPEANIGGVQVSLQSVYLKDCSYESPTGRGCRTIKDGSRNFSST